MEEYNAKQKRSDRRIKDYHEHIRHSRQEQEYHEVIFQIGNQDDTPVNSETGRLATEILKEYAENFQKRNPHLRVFNSVIHLDEATPHIHIDFVPFATEQKRGLSTRVSLTKALEQQGGFKGEGKFNTACKLWIDSEKEVLAELMRSRGIEWEQLGTHNEHLSVIEYKKQERQKEVAEIENDLSKLSEKKTKIKAIDDIQTKKTLLGDNLTISREDYEKLTDTAKKQIASEKKERKLKAEIAELKSTQTALSQENSELKKELSSLKSIRNQINTAALKQELEELKRKYSKVIDFIESLGLKQKLEQFLHPKNRILKR